MAHREGNNHPAGTPVADVVRYTPGKYVALNQSPLIGTGVKMLDVDGERAEFIFNDTRKAGRGLPGVGLMSPVGSSEPADAIRALAGGVIADRDYLTTKISEIDDLPKFIRAADGNPGDWVSARANFGNSAAAEDVADANGIFHPSITVFLLGQDAYQLGTEAVTQTIGFDIDLATVDADGDIPITWTPTFAGTFLSDWADVVAPTVAAAKAMTLTPRINATNITGGVIALTSANVIADATIAGSAVTALNEFDANDVITFIVSGLTAFEEGRVTVFIRYSSPTTQV